VSKRLGRDRILWALVRAVETLAKQVVKISKTITLKGGTVIPERIDKGDDN